MLCDARFDRDLSGSGLHQSRQHRQERAFAGSVWPEQGDALAARDFEIDPLPDWCIAATVRKCQILNPQDDLVVYTIR